MNIKVRIAPSPTGKLHLGTARTALFNFLFAKANNGKFILRFEDTDAKRSTYEAERDILEGLKWLKIKWDGKIIRQSERLFIYQKYLAILKDKGLVYECFCTEEELEKEREEMIKAGLIPHYSGKCKNLTEKEKDKLRKERKPAFRLDVSKVVETKKLSTILYFDDLIRGRIKRNVSEIGDFVLMKSDGRPVFFFAGAIDDYLMGITHVIRGEDHITNTFNQLLIFEALNFKKPHFAHLPLILEEDKSKMSKRRGGMGAVADLRLKGYLKEAVINFLVLLGWGPKDNKEFLSLKNIIKQFNLKDVKKGGSIFNRQKLDYLNGLWIRSKNLKALLKDFKEYLLFLKENGENYKEFIEAKDDFLLKVLDIFKTRITTLRDLVTSYYIFEIKEYDSKLLVFKKSTLKATRRGLKAFLVKIRNYNKEWTKENLYKLLKEVVKEENLSFGDVFWPVRVALSGASGSPSPQELLWTLGKEESQRRIQKALELIK